MKKLTEEFNNVTVAKGETFSIELPSNPLTDYKWDLKLKTGKAKLVVTKEEYITEGSELVVGSGKTEFVFKAEEAGTIKIEGQYKRPGENRPPAKLKTFSITVK